MGGYSEKELDAADPVYRRWIRLRLLSGEAVAWVSEARDGTPAASGVLWVQRVQPRPRWPSGATPYLMSMYTEPAHRGQGHAKRIVRAATAWTKEQGFPRATLHASEMGRPIYEALGWVRTWEMKWEPATLARSMGAGGGAGAGAVTRRAPARSPKRGRSR